MSDGMPYGKFKGKMMHKIPDWYVRWLAENVDDRWGEAADRELQWRKKNGIVVEE